MRIGVDATCWQNNRGYGRHARALLSTLVRLDSQNRYAFFLDSTQIDGNLPCEAEARLVQTSAPTVLAASSTNHRSLRDMWRMSRAMSGSEFDLLLFPTIYSYVPVFSRAKKIVMIHDVIPERYPQLTQPSRIGQLFWDTKVALGRWQADAIVTVSDYSRREILREFKTRPERVFVAGEASDPIFRVLNDPQLTPRLESLGIKPHSRLLLYVGGFGPHKNLQALVRVFARLAGRDDSSDLQLVMVGEYQKEVFYSHFAAIQESVERRGIENRVIFTGYLSDAELVSLLNLGTALVLPSLMEGFGLPAIEAAACGCPVIATEASPLPGLLGAGGIFFDPKDEAELQTALTSVLSSGDLRRRMREAGLAAAGRLTWDAAARQMMGHIQNVCAQ
jgi:glycosyltransferase involved in cell wall biosynthesis